MQDTVSYTVHSFLLTRRGEQEYSWFEWACVRVKSRNPYQPLQGILAEKGTHF